MSTMTAVLLIIFFFTFVPLILAEFARSRALPNMEDFFLHSRNMPLIMLFFTVYATWVSSFAFLGSTANLYYQGPLYMTCFAWNALFGILFMIIGRRLWFFGKRKAYITPSDFFNDVFRNNLLNVMVTGILAVFTLPYLMIQLYAGAYIIETVSGGAIPWKAAGFVFCLVIVIYLWAGGMRALALSDIFYGVITFATMLAMGFIMISKTGGVAETFLKIADMDSDFMVLGQGTAKNSAYAWLSMFIVIPVGALMGPSMWIRSFSARNERNFKVMPVLLLLATIMYLGPVLTAAAAKVLYPDLQSGDKLIPFLLMNNMHIVAATVLSCGIAAAALSTANSQIHGLAALFTVDVHKRYLRREYSGRSIFTVSKRAIIAVTLLVYIMMLKSPGLIIDVGTLGMGGSAQVIVPTLGALFWPESNSKAAVTGLFSGIAVLCVLCFLMHVFIPYAAVIALIVNAGMFVGLSYIFEQESVTRANITENILLFQNRHNDYERID